MPPRKNSASAAVAKPSKARAAKTASTSQATTTASKKATKSAAEKPVTTKAAASKKKPTAKSTATVAKANISKKRQRADDDDEDENEADTKPKSKKTKVGATSSRAVATKKPGKAKSTAKATSTAAKRKADDSDDSDASDDATPPPKKAKVSVTKKAVPKKAAPKKAAVPRKAAVPKKIVDPIMKVKIGPKVNTAPTTPLDIYVFGEGSAGELGLGAKVVDKKRPIDVMRPRKNILLSAPEVGVVQLACGGMHGLALTKDNKILSWGVNDQGALGRNTKWNGGLRDVDAPDSESEDEDDDTGLNPRESTPAEIDTSGVAPGTKFVQVTACDSASFALTEDGRIYGWGTFRVSLTIAPKISSLTNHMHSPAMVFLAFLQTSRYRKSLFCFPSPQRLFPSRRAPTMS